VVVLGPDGAVSAGDLDRRAGALARRLRDLGVGPEVLVGVCARRSAEVVAALLGVLRAGGAYLPLDHGYPPERLAFMLEDGRVETVLVDPGVAVPLPAPVRRLELGPSLFEGVGGGAAVPVSRDGLAYVIYTSGSTGRPKGVMVGHDALLNTLGWMQDTF